MEAQDQQFQAIQLAVTNRRMIEAYAFAIIRNFHLAEDVYQEVTLIIAKNWRQVPSEPGFTPWLKEVIRRKSRELWRQHNRTPRLSDQALEKIEAAFPTEPEHDLAAAMTRCLDKLQGDAKRAILGRYRDDHDVPRIAQQLGRTVQSAYAVLKRARLALKDCVERGRGGEVRT